MGKPFSIGLRERVIEAINGGMKKTEAAKIKCTGELFISGSIYMNKLAA